MAKRSTRKPAAKENGSARRATVFVLVCALVACGGEVERAPPPAPEPVRSSCPPDHLVGDGATCVPALGAHELDAIADHAAKLAAMGTRLTATESIDKASQFFAEVHRLDAWKRRATATSFPVIDVAGQLRDAHDQLHALAARFADASRVLVGLHDELAVLVVRPGATLAGARALASSRLVAAIRPLGAALDTAIPELYRVAQQAILQEDVFLNEKLCVTDEPALRTACNHAVASAALDDLQHMRETARRDFTDAAVGLQEQLATVLDGHASAAIDRATGRGPGIGQPCGEAELCESRLTCEHYAVGGTPVHTCERWCHEEAMQPCLAGTRCTKIDGLDRRVCRH